MKKNLLKIRTKNHTAQPLKNLIEVNGRAVFRLGSITPTEEIFPRCVALNKPIIEINTAEACHNSGDKIIMKRLFVENEVKTAEYNLMYKDGEIYVPSEYPVIIKDKNSCKGNGIYLANNLDEYNSITELIDPNFKRYIVEKYYNYSKEYRLHVTKDGCFYTCRKMLKEDAEERWHRHDMNSVWIMEENPLFEKPSNWDLIVEECVKAMKSLGLDICSVDMKVQSEKNHDRNGNPEFIILECNSASSMGNTTLIKYEEQLRKMLNGN